MSLWVIIEKFIFITKSVILLFDSAKAHKGVGDYLPEAIGNI